jgi:retinal pigment epithelial membrane protein
MRALIMRPAPTNFGKLRTRCRWASHYSHQKSVKASEGEGYLLGVAWHLDQNLRADVLILDAQHVADGPIATIHLPVQASPQIHGWWVREDQYPASPGLPPR